MIWARARRRRSPKRRYCGDRPRLRSHNSSSAIVTLRAVKGVCALLLRRRGGQHIAVIGRSRHARLAVFQQPAIRGQRARQRRGIDFGQDGRRYPSCRWSHCAASRAGHIRSRRAAIRPARRSSDCRRFGCGPGGCLRGPAFGDLHMDGGGPAARHPARTTPRPSPHPPAKPGIRQNSGERPLFQISRRSRDSVKALSLHTTPRKVAKGIKGGSRSGSRSTASRAMPKTTCSGSPLNKRHLRPQIDGQRDGHQRRRHHHGVAQIGAQHIARVKPQRRQIDGAGAARAAHERANCGRTKSLWRHTIRVKTA